MKCTLPNPCPRWCAGGHDAVTHVSEPMPVWHSPVEISARITQRPADAGPVISVYATTDHKVTVFRLDVDQAASMSTALTALLIRIEAAR